MTSDYSNSTTRLISGTREEGSEGGGEGDDAVSALSSDSDSHEVLLCDEALHVLLGASLREDFVNKFTLRIPVFFRFLC